MKLVRLQSIVIAIALSASPLLAGGSERAANSLAKHFGQTCLHYAPNVETIVKGAAALSLTHVSDGPYSMFEAIYGLKATNGEGVTFEGKTREGVGFELHVTVFDQAGERFYGCAIGSPEISSQDLKAAITKLYGFPGEPIVNVMQPSLHHRMWNFGSTDDPQYFILIGHPDATQPTAMIGNFGKKR